MGEYVPPKPTPDASSKLVPRYSNSNDFDKSFNYQSVIENIKYLEKGSLSDISYIKHQCAILSTCPMKDHSETML